MNKHTSPWERPGAEALHALLSPLDPRGGTELTRVVEQLDDPTREALAGLISTALARARADGFERGFIEGGGRP